MKLKYFLFTALSLIGLFVPLVPAAVNCHQQLYQICVNEKRQNLCGFIDSKGKIIFEPKYSEATRYLGEGLVAVGLDSTRIGWRKDGHALYESTTGLIDVNGNLTTLLKTTVLGSFSEGLVFAKMNGKFVYLDNSGLVRVTLPERVELADPFAASPPQK